jgi:hypothetical protein
MWPFGRHKARTEEQVDDSAAVPAWAADGAWRTSWEAPRNWIHSEGDQISTLARLIGAPCESGYLTPVDVVLEREPEHAGDENAVRASVHGKRVGYVARDVAIWLSPAMAEAKSERLVVPGVVRGGRRTSPHLSVLIWLSRSERRVLVRDDSGRVPWPPPPSEGDPAS